jgi:uncharacterized membrane protein (DUF485 family)
MVRRTLLKKAGAEALHNYTYGVHFAFLLLATTLLFIKLPDLVMAGVYTIKSNHTASKVLELAKYLAIVFGLTLALALLLYYSSYGVFKLLFPKSKLHVEIGSNSIGYVLPLGVVLLAFTWIVQPYFMEMIRYYTPQNTIPFYR